MIKSLLTEYGLFWVFNRLLYSIKLKMMTVIPASEKLFEKKVDIKRIDIFNLNVAGIKRFLKGLSREKQMKLVSAADKAVKGIIEGFSSIELDYGNPINWHYNPLTKVESKRSAKWYNIPDFDSNRGDIKVVWEASRFMHFFYFTRAYLITESKKYYIAFSEQLEQWLKDNPYSYGANYKCGQECALRMINILMAYAVFQSYGLTTPEDEKNVKKIVEVSYKKVLANFFYANKCIKNNHTLSEICGLIIGAWCCEDEGRIRKAYRLLDNEIQQQFLPDGGYIQYSFNYQRLVLQLMECIYKINEKTRYTVSERSRELIKNSAIIMYQVQDDTGEMPNYGSNDGALIFPVTVCGYRDFRPVVNAVYALVTGMRLFDKGDYDEELLWFGNSEEIPNTDIKMQSSAFTMAGIYTIRNVNSYMMICLQNFETRPTQMDQLHIDLWYKGKNIFCDSGTYSYATTIGKNMALTAAHNTAKVSGLEQMNKYGAFLVYDWTECKDVKLDANSFSGTMVSKNGYEHTRKIIKTERGYEIEDEVRGRGDSCSFLFHTPYEVKIVPDGFEIWDDGKELCAVKTDTGKIEVLKAYRSLYYLKKEEINCVVVNLNMYKSCNLKFEIELNN